MSQFGYYGGGGQFGSNSSSGAGTINGSSLIKPQIITLANENMSVTVATTKYGMFNIIITPYPEGQLGPYYAATILRYVDLAADGTPGNIKFDIRNVASSTNIETGINAGYVIDWDARGIRISRRGVFTATQFLVKLY